MPVGLCAAEFLVLSNFRSWLWRGTALWAVDKRIESTILDISCRIVCLDLGMSIFFFLYNLYLLDCGFKEKFLGAMDERDGCRQHRVHHPCGDTHRAIGTAEIAFVLFWPWSLFFRQRGFSFPQKQCFSPCLLKRFCNNRLGRRSVSRHYTADERKESSAGFQHRVFFGIGVGSGRQVLLPAGCRAGLLILKPLTSLVQAKQFALLVGCSIVALGILPFLAWRFLRRP